MKTFTDNSATSLPITAADAVLELAKLDLLLRERSAIRAARELELRELLGRTGGADALENIEAINSDMIRLSAALDIEGRALAGARQRIALLAPIVAADVERVAGALAAGLREALAIVQARAFAQLATFFDAEQLLAVVPRSRQFRAELGFQQAHAFGSGGLSYQIGDQGKPVLADDVSPQALVNAHRRAVELAASVASHHAEVKARE